MGASYSSGGGENSVLARVPTHILGGYGLTRLGFPHVDAAGKVVGGSGLDALVVVWGAGDDGILGGADLSSEHEAFEKSLKARQNSLIREAVTYRQSKSAARKEEMIRAIANAVDAKVPEDADIDTVAAAIKKLLPGMGSSNKRMEGDPKQTAAICSKIADKLNKLIAPGKAFPDAPFDVSAPTDLLCRQIHEYVTAVLAGNGMELFAMKSSIDSTIGNIRVMIALIEKAIAKASEKIEKTTDDDLRQGVIEEMELYKVALAELKVLMDKLSGLAGVSLGKTDEELAQAFSKASESRVIKLLKDKAGNQQLSNKVLDMLSTVGLGAGMTAEVNRSLKTVGMSLEDYKKSDFESLKKALNDLAVKKTTVLEQAQFEHARKYLMQQFGERSKIGGDDDDEDDKMFGGDDIYEGDGIEGGDDPVSSKKPQYEKRLIQEKAARKLVTEAFVDRLTEQYNNLSKTVKKFGDHIGTTVPLERLHTLKEAFKRLGDSRASTSQTILALAGFRPDNEAGLYDSYMSTLNELILRFQELESDPGFKGVSSLMREIISNIESIIALVKHQRELTASRRIGAGEAKMGGADDDLDIGIDTIISDINRTSLDITAVANQFAYAYLLAQMRHNMESVNELVSDSTEKYNKRLGEAIANCLLLVEQERKQYLDPSNNTEKSFVKYERELSRQFANDNDVDQTWKENTSQHWKTYTDQINKMHDAKVDFYKTLEAFSLYLVNYTHKMSGDVKALQSLHTAISGLIVNAKWYDENTVKAYQKTVVNAGTYTPHEGISLYAKESGDIERNVRAFYTKFQGLRNIFKMFESIGNNFSSGSVNASSPWNASVLYKSMLEFIIASSIELNIQQGRKIDDVFKEFNDAYAAGARTGNFKPVDDKKTADRTTIDVTFKSFFFRHGYDLSWNPAHAEGDHNLTVYDVGPESKPAKAFAMTNAGHAGAAEIKPNYNVGAMLCLTTVKRVAPFDGKHLSVNFDQERKLFTSMMHALAAKVMAAISGYKIQKAPQPLNMLTTERMILGGASSDDVFQEKNIELYYAVPRLMELYASLLREGAPGAAPSTMTIGLIPDISGKFTKLIQLYFINAVGQTPFRVSSGQDIVTDVQYSQSFARDVAREINVISQTYPKHDEFIAQLVKEINYKYGVVKAEEIEKYKTFVKALFKKNDVDTNVEESTNDIAILEGEGMNLSKSRLPSQSYRQSLLTGANATQIQPVSDLSFDNIDSVRDVIHKFYINLLDKLKTEDKVIDNNYLHKCEEYRQRAQRGVDHNELLLELFNPLSKQSSNTSLGVLLSETLIPGFEALAVYYAFAKRIHDHIVHITSKFKFGSGAPDLNTVKASVQKQISHIMLTAAAARSAGSIAAPAALTAGDMPADGFTLKQVYEQYSALMSIIELFATQDKKFVDVKIVKKSTTEVPRNAPAILTSLPAFQYSLPQLSFGPLCDTLEKLLNSLTSIVDVIAAKLPQSEADKLKKLSATAFGSIGWFREKITVLINGSVDGDPYTNDTKNVSLRRLNEHVESFITTYADIYREAGFRKYLYSTSTFRLKSESVLNGNSDPTDAKWYNAWLKSDDQTVGTVEWMLRDLRNPANPADIASRRNISVMKWSTDVTCLHATGVSLLERFNQVLASFIHSMIDSGSRKMYVGLLEPLLSSGFVQAINNPANGYGYSDTHLGDRNVPVGKYVDSWVAKGANGDDPALDVPNSVSQMLFDHLAQTIKTICYRKDPRRTQFLHAWKNLSEIDSPQIIKIMAGMLPYWMQVFKLLQNKVGFVKNLCLTSPSSTVGANPAPLLATALAEVELVLVKMQSVMQSTIVEIGKKITFGDYGIDFKKDYALLNSKDPLVLLSSVATYLRPELDQLKLVVPESTDSSSSYQQFIAYNAMVANDNTVDVLVANIKKMCQQNRVSLDDSALKNFVSSVVGSTRQFSDFVYRVRGIFPEVNPRLFEKTRVVSDVNLNAEIVLNLRATVPAAPAGALWEVIYPKLDNEYHFSPVNHSLAYRSSSEFVTAIMDSDQAKTLELIAIVLNGNGALSTRKSEIIGYIVSSGIMPIDIHALMRSTAFGPLFSYAIAFESFVSLVSGVKYDSRTAIAVTSVEELRKSFTTIVVDPFKADVTTSDYRNYLRNSANIGLGSELKLVPALVGNREIRSQLPPSQINAERSAIDNFDNLNNPMHNAVRTVRPINAADPRFKNRVFGMTVAFITELQRLLMHVIRKGIVDADTSSLRSGLSATSAMITEFDQTDDVERKTAHKDLLTANHRELAYEAVVDVPSYE